MHHRAVVCIPNPNKYYEDEVQKQKKGGVESFRLYGEIFGVMMLES